MEIVLRALSEVSGYDIFGTAVIIQIVYSSRKEPSVLFLPAVEDPQTNDEPKPDWRIEVAFSLAPNSAPRTTTAGTLDVLEPGSPNAKLSQAAIASIKHLSATGELEIPTVLRCVKTPNGRYVVGYGQLPVIMGGQAVYVQGGHWMVYLSEDFAECSVVGGR